MLIDKKNIQNTTDLLRKKFGLPAAGFMEVMIKRLTGKL
jgi:hypothetical protein